LADISDEYGARKKDISPEAIKAIKDHDWTGNIRELRNVVERLVIMSGEEISQEDVQKYL
jgi:DNA-binding NtrC family response regulator